MKNRLSYILILTTCLLHDSTSIFATTTSTFSRLYGDYFIEGFAQDQTLASPGSLDVTFGLQGTLDCSNQLLNGQVRAVQTLSNGSILAALSSPNLNSFLAEYNYAGLVDSGIFGTPGTFDLGAHSSMVQAMMLDGQNRILVAGGDDQVSGTNGWLQRVNLDGSGSVTFSGGTWRSINALAQQSNGSIIAVGFDDNNAQIARYTQGSYSSAGVLDTSFGSNGIISLNGSGLLPNITYGLYSVLVDAYDALYIACLTPDNNVTVFKFTSQGLLDTSFANHGCAVLSLLQNANPAQIRIAFDSHNNIIIAAQINGSIQVTSLVAATGVLNASFNNNVVLSNQNIFDLHALMTTTDNMIFLVGSNQTLQAHRVTRLTGNGFLDSTFNGLGYHEFHTGCAQANSLLSAAIGVDGRIYLAGYQVVNNNNMPVITSMYQDAYAVQVPQFPSIVQQGLQDRSFGSLSMYPGVVTPFDGLYGVALMQRARSVIELASTNILVGMDGYLSTSNNSNMILTRLTPAGLIDTNFAAGTGKKSLPLHCNNEYISSIMEDSATNIYVTGYSEQGAIIRQYSNQGSEQWVADISGIGYQGLGIVQQNSQRVLLSSKVSSTAGMLTAHKIATGALDTSFNPFGANPGTISATDFGLHMGPLYRCLVNAEQVIFMAYLNNLTGGLDVAALAPDGSGLISAFGINGVLSNIFSSISISPDNIRMGFDQNYNIIVAAAYNSECLVARLNGETGELDQTFNTSGILSLPSLGTSIIISKIIGVSDGSIIVVASDSAADDTMLIVRITSDGYIDTTFNSQSMTPGLVTIKVGNRADVYNARIATDACIQSSTGNIILSGYEELIAHDAMPMVMRIVGQSGTTEMKASTQIGLYPGMLDTSFSNNGSMPLDNLVSTGNAQVIYAYRSTDVNQGKILVGIDTGSSIKIARMNALSMSLDKSFGIKGIMTLTGVTGLNHISLDAKSNILIAGACAGQGWLTRLNASGSVDVIASVPKNIAAINHVYQQKSGRYIAACNDTNGNGVIVAWQDSLTGSNSSLMIDSTFNPLGTNPGQCMISTTGAYNLAINCDDTILVAYAANTIKIAQILANGIGLVPTFGNHGIITTNIIPKNSSEIRLMIDSKYNIILVSSGYTQNQNGLSSAMVLNVARYTSTGQVDVGFNGNGSTQIISQVGSAGVTLADCIVTHEVMGKDKIIVLGYNSGGANGPMFAVRLAGNGSLDATWNPAPQAPDVPGVLTYAVDMAASMTSGSIGIDGAIYCVGSTANHVPLVMRIVGDSYITQTEQQPFEVAAGQLDTTIASTGALNLNAVLGVNIGTPSKLYIYPQQGSLIASNSNGFTYITKRTAAGNLDFSFNGTGIVTIGNAALVTDMYVANGINDDGSIYLVGMNNGNIWAAKVTLAGAVTVFAVPNTVGMISVCAIRKTSNGRLLLAGQTNSSGVIVAYTSNGASLDTSFAVGLGYYATGVPTNLNNLEIDQYDRIYVAYKNSIDTSVKIVRIAANGSSLDTTFTPGIITPTFGLSASQIKLNLDIANQQVVVAVQDGIGSGNILKVARFNLKNGIPTGSVATISIPSNVLQLSHVCLDTLQNIYVIGYNSTNNYSLVARINSLNSSFIGLDATYGMAGIAHVSAMPLTSVIAGALDQDRRIYLLGCNNTYNAYMARLFGDMYVQQVCTMSNKAISGAIDLTLDPNDIAVDGGISLSGLTNWSILAGYVGKAIQSNSDGSSYIAFGNGVNVIIGKVTADMTPVNSFGFNGLTAVQSMSNVSSLIVDSRGRVVVVGTQNGSQKIVRFASNGTVDVIFANAVVSTSGTAIGEQTSGRVIVSGQIGSLGALYAYQNSGANFDTSFGLASSQGYYTTGVNTQIDDFVIDNNDNIYFVYRNNAKHVCLGKLMANGSGLVSSFHNGVIIDTGIIAAVAQPAHIAINNMGNILIAATTLSSVQTCLYNGATGAIISSPQVIIGTGSPVVTKVVGVGSDFIGSAYTVNNTMIAYKISGLTGSLDTNFGLLFNGLSYCDPNNALAVYAMAVQQDGKIVMVGTQGIAPVLLRLYGCPYLPQYAQMPGRYPAGGLDITLNPSMSGVFSLNGSVFSGYIIKRLYIYPNGSILLACDNGSNSMLIRVLKDFSLDTSNFNAPYGYSMISGQSQVDGLSVNQNGSIFVVGSSGNGWMAGYNQNGASLSGWLNPIVQSQGAFQIAQQSSSRLIVAGSGSLSGYTLNGSLDSQFAGGTGIVTLNNINPVATMFINNLDQIFIASVNSGSSVLQSMSADGGIITSLNSGTPISGITGNQLKIAQDVNGNIILAAATTTGFTIRRYTSSGNNSSVNPIIISAGTAGTSRLANMYTTSDGKIVLVGYETMTGNIIVARINQDFTCDSLFNAGAPACINIAGMNLVYDASIDIDGRIIIAGANNLNQMPSFIRVYGDDYVASTLQAPSLGVPGVLDMTFGLAGSMTISALGSGALNLTKAQAIVPLPDGGNYVALNNGTSSSQLIYMTAENKLNSSFGIAGFATPTVDGVNFMTTNGAGNMMLVGTSAQGYGWLSRYCHDNSGQLDTNFNGTGTVLFGQGTTARMVAEQTLARIIVVGQDSYGNGVIRALTNLGVVDETFNANGTPGFYNTGITTEIYAMAIDQFDRIICAYKNGSAIDIVRLHAHGVVDKSFGVAGIISGAIVYADSVAQVKLVMNAAGNIVVAAHTTLNNIERISIKAYDNLSAASGNGSLVNTQYDMTGLKNPVLQQLIATQDGKIIVLGNQSGTNPMWVARLNAASYGQMILDTTFNASGLIEGICTYAGSGVTNHIYNSLAVHNDGRMVIVGNEDYNPTMIRIYNTAYISSNIQAPNAKPVGTNDLTLGWTGNTGVTFFATPSGNGAVPQIAKAISLQDDNNILVALDGQVSGSNDNYMFLNMFDVSGLPNQNFGTAGKIMVPHNYQNEYINDMYSFTTATGINKALLVGYGINPTLNASGSLIMQYNTSSQSIDSSFGGFNGNPAGIVFGDALSCNSLARQSMGRIIVAGSGLDGHDILLGYTPTGLLDDSFGSGGCLTRGTNPLYAHVIDENNCIVIAYNDGNNNVAVARILANGSGLDTSFGSNGLVSAMISGVNGNNSMRIGLDSQSNIIVAAVNNAGTNCVVYRYRPDGTLQTSLTLLSHDLGTLTSFTLSKLLIDVHGKIIIVGNDTNNSQNKVIIARTAIDLSGLDVTFNQGQTPGYIAYTVGTSLHQSVQDGLIHPDGRILLVGAQG